MNAVIWCPFHRTREAIPNVGIPQPRDTFRTRYPCGHLLDERSPTPVFPSYDPETLERYEEEIGHLKQRLDTLERGQRRGPPAKPRVEPNPTQQPKGIDL